MRISDWSSDVCSSDLHKDAGIGCKTKTPQLRGAGSGLPASARRDVARAGRGYAPDGFFFPSSACSEARTTSTSLGATCTIRRVVPPTSRWKARPRSEEHTSELQSLMRISYAVFCLQKKINNNILITTIET